MKNGNTLTQALSHLMGEGEGESLSAGRRIGCGWDFREPSFGVPSSRGRERVRVRVFPHRSFVMRHF